VPGIVFSSARGVSKVLAKQFQKYSMHISENVTYSAPLWVAKQLSGLSIELQRRKVFPIAITRPRVLDAMGCMTYERSHEIKSGPLSLLDLFLLARNEAVNITGEIPWQQYHNIDPDLVLALKDLVREMIIIGKVRASQYGGYPKGTPIVPINAAQQEVIIGDKSGLQFQTKENTGRLFFIGPQGCFPKGWNEDIFFTHMTGLSKPSYEECAADKTGRFVKIPNTDFYEYGIDFFRPDGHLPKLAKDISPNTIVFGLNKSGDEARCLIKVVETEIYHVRFKVTPYLARDFNLTRNSPVQNKAVVKTFLASCKDDITAQLAGQWQFDSFFIPADLYFDTQAYTRCIAADFMNTAMMIENFAAENDIETPICFKFLQLGTGCFSQLPSEFHLGREVLVDYFGEGVAQGLAELGKKNYLKYIKAVELPYLPARTDKQQAALAKIIALCAQYQVQFLGNTTEDALCPRPGYLVATINNGDPHAPFGNEIADGQVEESVDSAMANNLTCNGFSFILSCNKLATQTGEYLANIFSSPREARPAPAAAQATPAVAPSSEVAFGLPPKISLATRVPLDFSLVRPYTLGDVSQHQVLTTDHGFQMWEVTWGGTLPIAYHAGLEPDSVTDSSPLASVSTTTAVAVPHVTAALASVSSTHLAPSSDFMAMQSIATGSLGEFAMQTIRRAETSGGAISAESSIPAAAMATPAIAAASPPSPGQPDPVSHSPIMPPVQPSSLKTAAVTIASWNVCQQMVSQVLQQQFSNNPWSFSEKKDDYNTRRLKQLGMLCEAIRSHKELAVICLQEADHFFRPECVELKKRWIDELKTLNWHVLQTISTRGLGKYATDNLSAKQKQETDGYQADIYEILNTDFNLYTKELVVLYNSSLLEPVRVSSESMPTFLAYKEKIQKTIEQLTRIRAPKRVIQNFADIAPFGIGLFCRPARPVTSGNPEEREAIREHTGIQFRFRFPNAAEITVVNVHLPYGVAQHDRLNRFQIHQVVHNNLTVIVGDTNNVSGSRDAKFNGGYCVNWKAATVLLKAHREGLTIYDADQNAAAYDLIFANPGRASQVTIKPIVFSSFSQHGSTIKFTVATVFQTYQKSQTSKRGAPWCTKTVNDAIAFLDCLSQISQQITELNTETVEMGTFKAERKCLLYLILHTLWLRKREVETQLLRARGRIDAIQLADIFTRFLGELNRSSLQALDADDRPERRTPISTFIDLVVQNLQENAVRVSGINLATINYIRAVPVNVTYEATEAFLIANCQVVEETKRKYFIKPQGLMDKFRSLFT
jgi:hypothetical protein